MTPRLTHLNNTSLDRALLGLNSQVMGSMSQVERMRDMAHAIALLKSKLYARNEYKGKPLHRIGELQSSTFHDWKFFLFLACKILALISGFFLAFKGDDIVVFSEFYYFAKRSCAWHRAPMVMLHVLPFFPDVLYFSFQLQVISVEAEFICNGTAESIPAYEVNYRNWTAA